MKIEKDSQSYRNAVEKSYRLLPEMFKMRVEIRSFNPIISRRVVGSKGFVYSVKIWADGISNFSAVCDCRAGQKEMCCYHIAAVYEDYIRAKIRGEIYSLRILPQVLNLRIM